MRYLLDTHVFLWWLADHPRLAESCRTLLEAPECEVLVSAASIWEMAIKAALGKLTVTKKDQARLDELIALCGFTELPVTAKHAASVQALPPHHADPFDRLLVGQALIEECTLVTADEVLTSYPIPILAADR